MGTPRKACYRCGAPVDPMSAYCDPCQAVVTGRYQTLDYCPMVEDDSDV